MNLGQAIGAGLGGAATTFANAQMQTQQDIGRMMFQAWAAKQQRQQQLEDRQHAEMLQGIGAEGNYDPEMDVGVQRQNAVEAPRLAAQAEAQKRELASKEGINFTSTLGRAFNNLVDESGRYANLKASLENRNTLASKAIAAANERASARNQMEMQKQYLSKFGMELPDDELHLEYKTRMSNVHGQISQLEDAIAQGESLAQSGMLADPSTLVALKAQRDELLNEGSRIQTLAEKNLATKLGHADAAAKREHEYKVAKEEADRKADEKKEKTRFILQFVKDARDKHLDQSAFDENKAVQNAISLYNKINDINQETPEEREKAKSELIDVLRGSAEKVLPKQSRADIDRELR